MLSLTLQAVYHLPYRQTEGFLRSVFGMMGITVKVPNYSTVNRRAKSVDVPLEARTCCGNIHVNGIGQCSVDGAYGKMKCYDALGGIRATIPRRRGAKIHQHGNRKAVPKHPRDENIRTVRAKGRKAWKQESGYHHRSKAEVAMFRYKTIFGEMMNARETQHQEREGQIKCRILNLMLYNGMPKSVVRQAA